ncbi:unnamed protein product [Dibothriocephalus latus]|uniref:Uncharacterized protein n=1 Tax=Dibothriocephalus latus TaxID=60516 RepID=A0A3P7LIU9_DIBLA|nr:unnamed protein product [Dibothriocephalus latus]
MLSLLAATVGTVCLAFGALSENLELVLLDDQVVTVQSVNKAKVTRLAEFIEVI